MNVLGREIHLGSIIDNPSIDTLRGWALEKGGAITQFGSLAVTTQTRNRLSKFTEIIMGDPQPKEAELLNKVLAVLPEREFIQLDRVMCLAPGYKTPCRVYVTSDYPRLPLMWGQTLFPTEGQEPEFITIALPDWDEKRTMVFPGEGITIIVGSDYKGEIKKAMLRQLMYHWKEKDCLGCHAGSKVFRIYKNRKLHEYGALFFGNSGTGKTSLCGHSHWMKHPETVRIRQDDVVILTSGGEAMGTEDSFYIKTDALEPKTQPLLYAAALSPRTILENVKVAKDTGEVDFNDSSLTSNGRAMVKRGDIAYTDDKIDLDKVHFIFFITRSFDIVPPVARLTPEWAAAVFMLGETVETSAGDPSRAGQPLRVVGTNPFIIGSRAQEGNIFLDILHSNPQIQCFLLNTGRVGGMVQGQRIKLPDTLQIIEMVVRGKIKWRKDEFWGYEVAEEIPGLDLGRFDPAKFYSDEEIRGLSDKLKRERLEWLKEFTFLKPEVANALNP